tara:strand:- start:666 stop:818 length:153 start_codon:yes stop_codon:yes gene_type:complete
VIQQTCYKVKSLAKILERLEAQASSPKHQASSLTAGEGYCRMDLERINYD